MRLAESPIRRWMFSFTRRRFAEVELNVQGKARLELLLAPGSVWERLGPDTWR